MLSALVFVASTTFLQEALTFCSKITSSRVTKWNLSLKFSIGKASARAWVLPRLRGSNGNTGIYEISSKSLQL